MPDSGKDLTLGRRAGLQLSQLRDGNSDFALGSALQGRPKDGWPEVGPVDKSCVDIPEQVCIHMYTHGCVCSQTTRMCVHGGALAHMHPTPGRPQGAHARGPHTQTCTDACQGCVWAPRGRVRPRTVLPLSDPRRSPCLMPMDSTTSPCVSRVSTAHTPG